MRYAIVIEKADGNYSAYVPDLPGCVATGETVEAIEREIRNAIRFHIEGLQDDGLPVPQPTSMPRMSSLDRWPLASCHEPSQRHGNPLGLLGRKRRSRDDHRAGAGAGAGACRRMP